jgi:hypothetical protein
VNTSHIVLYIYAHLKVNGTSIHKFTMTNLLLSIPHTDISKLTCQTVNTSHQTVICVKCSTLDYMRNELRSRIHLLLKSSPYLKPWYPDDSVWTSGSG